jgi:hypothetical protein
MLTHNFSNPEVPISLAVSSVVYLEAALRMTFQFLELEEPFGNPWHFLFD